MTLLAAILGGRSVEPAGRQGDFGDVEPLNLDNHMADYDIVRKMRASFNLVLGPMLASDWGRRLCHLPGGCAIGARPMDLHIYGLEKLGR